MSRYVFDRQYGEVFKKAGIDLGDLLRRSQLPEDLFGRRDILLTRTEYFRLVETLGTMAKSRPDITRQIAIEGRIETFAPPAFAAYCSRNGMAFLERFAQYKRLIGPVKLRISQTDEEVCIEVKSDDEHEPLPAFFAEIEMVFLLGILRKSTQTDIEPLRTTADTMVLRTADLQRPFVDHNDAMWQYIEPELRRRLSEMEVDDTMAVRVRSALVELLPAGKTTVDDVASKLCLSKRTLQRKLADEQTTFQQQLNATRLLLAKNYLRSGNRTSHDIAFLLGYEDTTSFLRAFNAWTGQTITEYKRQNP